MNKEIENIKQQLEEVIKKNLPPNDNRKILSFGIGFNQALSQINTSLIADEVLKVVVESCPRVEEIKQDGEYLWVKIPNNNYKSFRILPDNS